MFGCYANVSWVLDVEDVCWLWGCQLATFNIYVKLPRSNVFLIVFHRTCNNTLKIFIIVLSFTYTDQQTLKTFLSKQNIWSHLVSRNILTDEKRDLGVTARSYCYQMREKFLIIVITNQIALSNLILRLQSTVIGLLHFKIFTIGLI